MSLRRRNSPPARLASLLVACALLAPYFAPPAAGSTAGESAARARVPAPAPPAARSAPRRQGGAAYRAGQLLVRFRDDTGEADRAALAAGEGAARRALRGGSGVEMWALPQGKGVETTAAVISSRPAVEFAEPNYLITADQLTPSDPRFPEQWALQNTGQSGGEIGSDVGALRAWAKTTGSPGTVIAVVDGGIDFSHPDLAKNLWQNPADRADGRDDDGNGLVDDLSGWDWIGDTGGAKDPGGHGTAIAGLIAAEGDNGIGTAGVMWRASLMSLRVLDESGTGDVASAVEALDYASSHGAHVINCSWGTDAESRALYEAASRAGRSGALVVASAGNDGRNIDASPRYPAAYDLPHVISVASTNNLDQLAPWSNWGARGAHVAAPGVDLLTAAPGGAYRAVSGTSASAALVAGVAGLVKSLRPGLAPARLRDVMARNVRAAPGLAGRVSAGGVLSAADAVGALDRLPADEGDVGTGSGGDGRKKDKDKEGDGQQGAPPAAGSMTAASGGPSVAPKVQGVRGRPATNLPDLDVARRHQPRRPQAPPPIPSSLRNCPPHNPRCNGGAAASPTPTPVSSLTRPHERVFVAAAGYRLPRLDVKSDLSLLEHIREAGGTPDTDASTYFDLPRLYTKAAGLLPALFAAAAQSGNNSAFVSQSVPSTMIAGQTYNVSVTLQNTGSTTWSAANSYRLGAQNPENDSVWRLGRVQLPTSVAQGETANFAFTVTAPTAAGAYNFQWRMVQDAVEWFGPMTPNVQVAVSAPSFEGWFDSASCPAITGWAWTPQQPNTPIEVDVFEEVAGGADVFLARVVADQYRADLAAAGKGDGRHGFSFAPPAALRDGQQHSVKARVANTSFLPQGAPALSGSPKTVPGCAALPGATAPPSNLVVTLASDSQIGLSWTPAAGAARYRVERAPTKSGPFTPAGSTAGTTFSDTAVSRPAAYLYRVCSSDSSGEVCVSPYGNVALGTAYSFFEPSLVAQVTTAKAQHFAELRQTVNSVRAAAELPAASWGEAVAAGGVIRAAHVRELRTKLTEALSALHVLPPSYTDPALAEQVTVIRRAHVEELRLRSTRASGTVSAQPAQTGTLAPTARLDARNRTGGGGVDLLSGNFNWSLPLLGLKGRAGLDLGLALSYNSLVWTKQGSILYFNPDEGYPAPGFRLGFPVVQAQYYNTGASANSYLLLTPSGQRVELRQTPAGHYESVDSSYLKLQAFGGGLLYLWAPDGTRVTFMPHGYRHFVSEIRDRNGNRLAVGHDTQGRLTSVTDTLARTINFNYDANQNLLSITQERGGQQYTWATFGYGVATVGDVFTAAVATAGAQEGQAANVLTQVGLADGSSYRFEYNDYAQVKKISRHSADDHQLAYTAYVLQASADDCPRVTARREWAIDWNNGQEAVTTYARDAGGAWGEATAPDATRYRELYAALGWQQGLMTGTEVYAGAIRQKWTEAAWAQEDADNSSLAHRRNPRVTEGSVYDKEGNRRRTKTLYYTAAELRPPPEPALPSAFGLAKDIVEYDADAATVLRRTHLEYNAGTAYVSSDPLDVRHLVALVRERHVYEGGGETSGGVLRSKVAYSYDETADDRLVATPATPTQHDASFGTGKSAGRGNLTGVKRWNVGEVNGHNPASVETKIGYNTTGSVVFTTDAEGHKALVSYDDSFSDNVSRNTFAYPTAATDPDQAALPEAQRKRSLTKYQYETGAVTRVEGVSPNEGQAAPAQVFQYDAIGRLERVTNLVTNAYTRYVYGPGQTWVQSFTTLKDAPAQPEQNVSTEAYSIQVMDGAGRVYASAGDFPVAGSSVTYYRGQHTVYDAMGRAVRSSNPTQMTSAWEPVDEDAADAIGAGWYYAEQDYDWMGRPTYSRHADGVMSQELIYGGCGCAGGEVTTIRDALDRKQKVHRDALGRVVKTQALNFNGTVYSATLTAYNALDQATKVREFKGDAPSDPNDQSCPALTCQEAEYRYDGHARLKESHRPEERTQAGEITWAQYTYYGDDLVKTVTDPRGAGREITYNGRHLTTFIDYGAAAGVATTPDVTYSHDAAGNVISMADGAGGGTYKYDQLSRLEEEERRFAALESVPNTNQGRYKLKYEYAPGGALEKITDHSNKSVGYVYDKAGQLTDVTGTGYTHGNSGGQQTDIPSFASGMKYRAWGGLKEMTYGNGAQHKLQYDAQLRPTRSVLDNLVKVQCQPWPSTTCTNNPHGMTWDYEYHGDGRLQKAFDRDNPKLDSAYSYDHVGRLKEALSGLEARGGTFPAGTDPDSPYRHTYTYDEWGHMTKQAGRVWWQNLTGRLYEYANNRVAGWTYDAAGQVLDDQRDTNQYDTEGQRTLVKMGSVGGGPLLATQAAQENTYTYDGAGGVLRLRSTIRTEEYNDPNYPNQPSHINEHTSSLYYLRSTVLGGYVVAELDDAGQAARRYVYAGGRRLAKHESQWGNTITWQHKNAMTESWVESGPERWAARAEMDPMGAAVGETAHPRPQPNEPPPSGLLGGMSYIPIEGSPTQEAELGMQLYEDMYIKPVYGSGGGTGQEGITLRDWADHVQNRLGELMAGNRFLFGMEAMQAGIGVFGSGQYEEVKGRIGWRASRREGEWEDVFSVSYRRVPGARRQGGGGGQPQNAEQGANELPSDCGIFVEQIMNIYQRALSMRTSTRTRRPTWPSERLTSARQMLTSDLYGFYNGYKSVGDNDIGVSGFRLHLTEFQGAGVYRHVTGGAAVANLGLIGAAGRAWQDRTDRNQINDPNNSPERRAEGYTDLAGTAAGWNVGVVLKRGIDGAATANTIRDRVFEELCER